MLHDFVRTNTAELITRARQKVLERPWPPPSDAEVENGIPMFLGQLAETLRLEESRTPFSPGEMDASAGQHGRELLGMGFTVSQVVHDYGDVCQAITELASENESTISSMEFHTLNRCLDDAIASAVTEYGRLKEEATALLEVAISANLQAEYRDIRLSVGPVDPALVIDVDRQLLTSALMNLIQNALKFTPAKGGVSIRTRAVNGRVFIEVEAQ